MHLNKLFFFYFIKGDTALRSLATSPIEEQYQAFVGERGSRVSLNETPVPKHRKTRFQQPPPPPQMITAAKAPKARFDDERESEEIGGNRAVEISSNKKNRRASFMPSKIITTATKQLINQHLFGLQSLGSSKGGACAFLDDDE